MKDNIQKLIKTGLNNPTNIPWRLFQVVRRILPLDYFFLPGYAFPPDIITILNTKRCNFNCQGCSSVSPEYTKGVDQVKTEMNLKQIKKIIDEVAVFKPSIYLNGGEPTLRSDLIETINYIKTKKLIAALTTNGSMLTKELAEEIVKAGLDFFSISIDGQSSYHNKKRGFPYAYERAVMSINLLKQARQDLNSIVPHIRITCVIDGQEIKNPWHVLALANRLGVDEVAYGNLMTYHAQIKKQQDEFIKKHGAGGPVVIGLEVSTTEYFKTDIEGLKDFYKRARSKSNVPVYLVLDEKNLKDFYSIKYPKFSRCLTPWLVAVIQPNGDMSPCQDFMVGNVLRDKFLNLWNNQSFKKFRRIRKKYQMPACWRCIEGQEIKFERK